MNPRSTGSRWVTRYRLHTEARTEARRTLHARDGLLPDDEVLVAKSSGLARERSPNSLQLLRIPFSLQLFNQGTPRQLLLELPLGIQWYHARSIHRSLELSLETPDAWASSPAATWSSAPFLMLTPVFARVYFWALGTLDQNP